MPTPQHPVGQALTAIHARSRSDSQTSENLIASQKTREFSASTIIARSSTTRQPPFTISCSPLDLGLRTLDSSCGRSPDCATGQTAGHSRCGRSPDRATCRTGGLPSHLPLWPVSRPCHPLDRRSPCRPRFLRFPTSRGEVPREAAEAMSSHQLTSLQSTELPFQKIKKGKRLSADDRSAPEGERPEKD